jgi:hypothetical protein
MLSLFITVRLKVSAFEIAEVYPPINKTFYTASVSLERPQNR